MTHNITNAIPEIAEVIVAVTGINAPQGVPRENVSEFPMAMVYIFDGIVSSPSYGTMMDLDNIAIDILTPRRDIAEDLPVLHAILDACKKALWSEIALDTGGRFDSSIDTFQDIAISFLPDYVYAGVEMIGYRLVMQQVKLLDTL
jgi:hypothetical protein